MTTTICFDFGNTRLKAAVFEQDQLKEIVILPDDNRSTIEEIIQKEIAEARRKEQEKEAAEAKARAAANPTPRSAATRRRDNPLVNAIRTASCLKSSVCFIISSVSLYECLTLK